MCDTLLTLGLLILGVPAEHVCHSAMICSLLISVLLYMITDRPAHNTLLDYDKLSYF